jgi:hypothetical protein
VYIRHRPLTWTIRASQRTKSGLRGAGGAGARGRPVVWALRTSRCCEEKLKPSWCSSSLYAICDIDGEGRRSVSMYVNVKQAAKNRD